MVGNIYCSYSSSVDVLVAVCDSVTEIKNLPVLPVLLPSCVFARQQNGLIRISFQRPNFYWQLKQTPVNGGKTK